MLKWMPIILNLEFVDTTTYILRWIGNYERPQRRYLRNFKYF